MFIVGIGTDIIEIDRIVGMPDNARGTPSCACVDAR